MKIETGLFNQIVLQRTRRDVSDAAFTGTCKTTGPVQARVTRNGRTVRGFGGAKVGQAQRGRFSGAIKGLKAGGPYDISLCIGGGRSAEQVVGKNVLVGDVWIVAGQSNAQGCGLLKDAAKPHPMVRAFYMDDRWRAAKDPIHNMWAAIDPVHPTLAGGPALPNTVTGVGPGVAFGQEMHRRTGVPQGLLACSHGGTNMAQWDPSLKKLGGESLYGATVRRLVKNGGKIAGVVWYQGESDALDNAVDVYTAKMKRLIRAFRRDAHDVDLPIVVVQLASVCGHSDVPQLWNAIQDQQRRLGLSVKRCAIVPSIDLTLDDTIHISGVSQQVLGRRLAEAMHVLIAGRKAGKPPIALGKVSIRTIGHTGWADIVVEFENVAGALQSGGSRAMGFELVDGEISGHVYDTVLERNRAIVRTDLTSDGMSNMGLYYGFGNHPACNITDAADRSLPMFGPVRVGRLRALTPFQTHFRLSRVFDGAGNLSGLKRPHSARAMGWRDKRFAAGFCDVQTEWRDAAQEDRLIYYACKLQCDEAMKLNACVGYDGPVKMWIDGRLRYQDPDGINPGVEDQGVVPFRAARGEHEVIVALGSNHGMAWGMMLRFERTDVTAAELRRDPAQYVMPRVSAS